MNKKLICFLLLIIIIFSSILMYKINKTYEYDPKIYDEVYQEYEEIISTTSTSTEFEANSSTSQNKPIYTYKNSTGSTYRTVGIVQIPKIGISYPIINDYSEANLNIAPTKVVGPELNEVGNFVIAAHNNRNEEFFSNLYKLEKGDIVNLTDHNKITKSYKVYDKYEVHQSNFSCLDQNTNGKAELTLITCVKFNNRKRLIVKCVEQ